MATTKSTNDRLLASVEATYCLAEAGFDRMHSAAKTPEMKERVRELYGAARDAYWKAVVASLEDESGVVAAIHDDLRRTNRDLKRALEDLKDLVKALELLRDAVKLAAALVTLAAA
jgi:hypothetical protein